MPVKNIFSVDVEDYFHVEAFTGVVDRGAWGSFECRVEGNTLRMLDLADRQGVRGTFFILGWVAERYPKLVREIVRRGHEPACHSYWHRLVYSLKPDEFRDDTTRAKDCIEQAAGEPVFGYRAPSFSIMPRSSWALDILAELGFRYDSSVFPVKHDVYGVPHAPRSPFQIPTRSGSILEFPMTTFHLGAGPNLPLGGGGYLRMLPGWYTRFGMAQLRRERLPVICYVHPWEIDPEQPRIRARLKSRVRHYTNLSGMAGRLEQFIKGANFTSFRESGMLSLSGLQTVRL